VGLFGRLKNKALVQTLYESVHDAKYRQLINALRWGTGAVSLPSPPSACHLDWVLPLITPELMRKQCNTALFYLTNPIETRYWLLQHADLSDPIVLQAVLRCTCLRFNMLDFLNQIEVDLIQLPDLFPLLISPLWKDDGNKWFFYQLEELRNTGKRELVAAILQLPAVLQYCRSHMEYIIKKNDTVNYRLYRMLDLESRFVSELFSFRFGPGSRPITPLVL
jgi:hypothetical protein